MSDSPDTLLAGDEIASHLILRVLEREEAGWVYLAEDPDGARVRLRIMGPKTLSDEVTRGRVLQDLATLQALEHPNLSRFLAYGEEDDVFYSLEHNGNATLFDLVYHRRPLNGEELLWVARGLASALSVLHEAGIPHGQLGATSVVLRDDGPVLVDLGLDTRLDPGYDAEATKRADVLALQQVLGFAASGPSSDGDETQALPAASARLINALSQTDTIAEAVEAIDRLVEDSAKTGVDTQPALDDFMSLLEASDYSSGVYRRLDVTPKTEVISEQVLPVSSVEGAPLTDSGSDFGATGSDLMTSQDVLLREDSGAHVPLVDPGAAPDVSQEAMFESEERTTPLVESPEAYPRRLGDYVLLEEIGTSPGGTVHLARAKEAQNLVALRTLSRKAYRSAEDLEKLWRKADAAASLEHPVFARTLDRGEVDGEAFLVSELLAGRNLDELAAQGVDIERGLLPQLLPVLEAVAEANDAGIVNGHLRADHVLVDGQGCPRLIDFGIGASLGKPPKNEPSDDVESASKLIYYLATGGQTPPSEGWRVTLLGQPVPPSAFVSGLRSELDAVLLKALAAERRARYPNVSALREDLERVLAGGVPIAPAVPAPRRAALWVVTRPLLAASLALWALCTLVFFVMALSSSPPPAVTPPPQTAGLSPEEVEAQRGVAAAEALVGVAESLYSRGEPEAAIVPFSQALLLAPNLEAAVDGQGTARRAVEAQTLQREEARRDATLALQDAMTALGEGDASAARGHLETATDMQRILLDSVGAEQADAELTSELVRLALDLERLEGGGGGSDPDREALARLVRQGVESARQSEAGDRRQRAAQLTQQGDAALAKQDKATASRRYLDALALDPEHEDALHGLRESLTPELDSGETGGDKVAQWALDQRERLRADAERARGRGEHKRAEERLLQALAFAPRDAQLQGALEAVRAKLRGEQSGTVSERVDAAVKRGEAALNRARTATDRGDAALHFFTAQGEFSTALALDPNRSDLAGELSKIKEEAVELFTPQAPAEAAATRPDDPHLQFEEADEIAITRALGRKVRFAPPGNVFAKLREEVEQIGKGRFRVLLRLRTRAERVPQGSLQSVRVVARGFEVQLEDKQDRVRWPWRFQAFEDGPYPRATRVERDGTVVVAPLFAAQPAVTTRELSRVRGLIEELIEKALEKDER